MNLWNLLLSWIIVTGTHGADKETLPSVLLINKLNN
jgi:hypothetical protein